MKKRNPFSSFDYLVDNLFTYQDKVEVKVFYIYRDKRVMVKTITLKKIKGKDETYYLKEAKKVVRASIKDGSLTKDTKKELAKRKKKRICVLATTAGAAMIVGVAIGCYYGLKPPVYEIEVPDINGLIFDNNKPVKGRDYVAKFSINSKLTDEILPLDLSLVKVGNKNCEYTYTPSEDYLSATLFISKEYITDDVQVYFSLREIPWYSNNNYLKKLTKNDIGTSKTITVNQQEHKVRLIGIDQDVDANGNKLHTTWEFENLISDKRGYALAAYWKDTNAIATSNYNYFNSTVRAVLNGNNYEGSSRANINWFQYLGEIEDAEGTGKNRHFSSDYKDKSVLDMLPHDLLDKLAAPSKLVNTYNHSESKFTESVVNDKLFLLSPREMGYGDDADRDQEENTFTYKFYDTHTEYMDSFRIKQQVRGEEAARTNYLSGKDIEGAYHNSDPHVFYTKYVTAGLSSTIGKGCPYWLRSPYSGKSQTGAADGCAWYVDDSFGLVDGFFVHTYDRAYGIAPAFCI